MIIRRLTAAALCLALAVPAAASTVPDTGRLDACLARGLAGLDLVGCLAGGDAPATPAAPADDTCVAASRANDACPLWTATYDNGNDATPQTASTPDEVVAATLLSADEERLYVAGRSYATGTTTYGYAVVAYEAESGEELWVARYDAGGNALPAALAESPDGATVYVSGTAPREDGAGTEILTRGLAAGTGATTFEWRWHADDPNARGVALAVRPDGDGLYVGGVTQATAQSSSADYAIAAYDFTPPEGEDPVVWSLVHDNGDFDGLNALALAPDGSRLYATGQSKAGGGPSDHDIATLALDAQTGEVAWERRRDQDDGLDAGNALALSPDGATLFVAGIFGRPGIGPSALGPSAFLISEYAVLAYDTATGEERWAARHGGVTSPISGLHVPSDIEVDDRGERVFVTGISSGAVEYDLDVATIAVDVASGAVAWEARYATPGHNHEYGAALAYDPGGDRVYVAGASASVALTQFATGRQGRYVALSLDAGNGTQVAAMRYGGTDKADEPRRAFDYDAAAAVEVGEATRRLFVAGTLGRRTDMPVQQEWYGFDFGTLAYALPGPGLALPGAGGWSSYNLEYVGHVPLNSDTAGAKIVGDHIYVTTGTHLKIYDISTPEVPVFVGALAYPGEEAPYFAEEDPDTNGKILLVGSLVIDVSDPANPTVVGDHGQNAHTISCVLDCTWAHLSDGKVIDLRDPANPRYVRNTGFGGHDVTEVAPGFVLTASNPMRLLDSREDPANPTLLATGQTLGGFFNHGVGWPNQMTDDMVLVGGESGTSNNCASSPAARLWTFDATRWQEDGTFRPLHSYVPPNGLYHNGQAPVDLFCAHWFDEHPEYRNGGLVAMAWYEHGIRLLRVTGDGRIHEIGYFIGYGSSASAAYWASDDIIYSLDYHRGFDILRYTGRA